LISNSLLLGIDFEDQERLYGKKGTTRLKKSSKILMRFLKKHKIKTTFFIVGDVARENDKIIEEIILNGHEIACHSNNHIPLNQLNSKKFSNDLKTNKKILEAIGAKNIYGYRAPRFSLTKKHKWVYEVLKDEGFKYSSSVLPGNPVEYGWKDIGPKPILINKILEIPITMIKFPFFSVPYGGLYLRLIPEILLLKYINNKRFDQIVSYIHPYDFDFNQKPIDSNINYFKNKLLFYNRLSTYGKLDRLVKKFKTIKYIDFFNQIIK